MPKKSKLGPTRHDKYWHLAKEQGYRSRAAFKLVQLNKTYNFLGKARALLDLCAAPGGWLQVAEKNMPSGSLIIGIDLLPIKPIKNCITFQEDITSQKCRALIKREVKARHLDGVDVVIHDGAPNVGGATWDKDAYGQIELVLYSLKLAIDFLRSGGVFVTKVFRSQDYNSLLWVLQKFFKKTSVTKPPASRNTSAEIYVICEGFLAPKSIDPRLLDPAHIFKHIEQPKSTLDVFHQKGPQARRHRDGYEDGAGLILFKQASVAAFVDSNEPVQMLGEHNKFSFDKDSEIYKTHAATTEDIQQLLSDLKVLGKGDFSALMKWRGKMREFKKKLEQEQEQEQQADVPAAQEAVPVTAPLTEEEKEALEEEQLTTELDKLSEKLRKKQRNEKRHRREKIFKERRRVELNMTTPDDIVENAEEQGLFHLSSIKDPEALAALAAGERGGFAAARNNEEEEKEEEENEQDSDEDPNLKALRRKYGTHAALVEAEAAGHDHPDRDDDDDDDDDEDDDIKAARKLESDLDFLYKQYKVRRQIVTAKQKAKAEASGLEYEAEEDATLGAVSEAKAATAVNGGDSDDGYSDSDSDGCEEDGADADGEAALRAKKKHNPLLVSLGNERKISAKERAERWFSRNVFDDIDIGSGTASAAPASADSKKPHKSSNSAAASVTNGGARPVEASSSSSGDEDAEAEASEEESENDTSNAPTAPGSRKRKRVLVPADSRGRSSQQTRAGRAGARQGVAENQDEDEEQEQERKDIAASGFEEVPVAVDNLSDISDDDQARAEIQALGQLLIRKKSRNALIDGGFNRYSYNNGGGEDLPEWFLEDEDKHNKAQLPITKEEVDLYKMQLKAIDARPIKKIAEAKARKKFKAVKRWEKLKSQAEVIAENETLSEKDKLRTIEKLYNKKGANKKKPVERKYVVAKKTGGKKQLEARKSHKGPVKLVDPRQKKDKRAQKALERKKKKRRS